mmetsp:Transcript_15763/g.22499  ORF Transcript_15763/g.22499 Transcript_15763/m.22499 type:complete len:510 (-) Transcript_15763:75-1604(-)
MVCQRSLLRRVSAVATVGILFGRQSTVVAFILSSHCQIDSPQKPQEVTALHSPINSSCGALHAVTAALEKKKSDNKDSAKVEIIREIIRATDSSNGQRSANNILLVQSIDGDDEGPLTLALKIPNRATSSNSPPPSSSSNVYSTSTSTIPTTGRPPLNTRQFNKRTKKPTAADRLVSQCIIKIRALQDALNAREEYTAVHNIAPPTDSEWAASAMNPPIPVTELRRIIQEGRAARESLLSLNEGLVVSIAKRYQSKELLGAALTLQDMIQEGKMGVLEAAERFKPEKGFKFSTYAVFWIRQRILRCLADHSRSIRLPIHVQTILANITKVKAQMALEIGRQPSIPELAHRMNLTVAKLKLYMESSRKVLSLENRINRHSGLKADERVLSDWIASDCPTPQDMAEVDCLKQNIRLVLEGLSERERNVLLLRFGLDDGTPKAADEVAKRLRIPKDRVRPIEARALNKLRHPGRNYKLKDYIEVQTQTNAHLDDEPFRNSPFGNIDTRWSFL